MERLMLEPLSSIYWEDLGPSPRTNALPKGCAGGSMNKLQIIATINSEGMVRYWVARAPEAVYTWQNAECRNVVLGPALPCDEAYLRLKHLKAPRIPVKLHRLLLHLRGKVPARGLSPDAFDYDSWLTVVQSKVGGRIIFQDRLIGLLRSEGLWPSQIEPLLDYGVYHGGLSQLPGVSRGPWGQFACNRCGGRSIVQEPCLRCQRMECPLCLDCLTMGESRGCQILVYAPQQVIVPQPHVDFQLSYDLTPAQARAALQLEKFLESDEPQTMVWAACGAGKTEVTFGLIRRALRRGDHVLFAIPRQDIVRELAVRLQSAFKGVELAVHYGGQPWDAPGNLVIATTHQVLHFYQRFGLVILDEMDAFPYQGSEMLRFGLIRSLKPGGKLVEMSATPNPVPKPGTAITIPVRHHGHPLPVPEVIRSQPNQLPNRVLDLLRNSNKQWIVFVPTVNACSSVKSKLCEELNEEVAVCHSKLPDRVQQIDSFKNGHRRIMVATSVLERGVTFPGVQVIVFDAHHPVYTRSALVQMAGRVGRTTEQPTGRVLFCAAKATPAIKEACTMISELNQEGARLGLLNGDDSA